VLEKTVTEEVSRRIIVGLYFTRSFRSPNLSDFHQIWHRELINRAIDWFRGFDSTGSKVYLSDRNLPSPLTLFELQNNSRQQQNDNNVKGITH